MKITTDELTELMLIDGVLHGLGERCTDTPLDKTHSHLVNLEKRLSAVINKIKNRPVSFLENLKENR